MAKADPELRFKCLELGMKASVNKVEGGIQFAKQFVEFVEQEDKAKASTTKKTGTTAKAAPKTAGKTAARGTKAQE